MCSCGISLHVVCCEFTNRQEFGCGNNMWNKLATNHIPNTFDGWHVRQMCSPWNQSIPIRFSNACSNLVTCSWSLSLSIPNISFKVKVDGTYSAWKSMLPRVPRVLVLQPSCTVEYLGYFNVYQNTISCIFGLKNWQLYSDHGLLH